MFSLILQRGRGLLIADGTTMLGAGGLLEQTRGRKRALKRQLTRQERILRKQKREEKEAARKQYTFMERIKIRQMKSLLSPSQQGPGRYNPETEAELPDVPPTDVYLRSAVKSQFVSIANALAAHRALQRPEIYNNPNAAVQLRFELNMTTDKATKLMSAIEEIVPVPHTFEHKEKRSILALAADAENQEAAVAAGAEMGVGADMIKKILKGQFRVDDYDFCVAHSNMSTLIPPLRGVLRSRFPTPLNGAMSENIADLVQKFRNGVKIFITPDPVFPIWGLCEPIVGKLVMPDAELEANIAVVIEAICKHRNPALGPFINRATLSLASIKHYIPVDVSRYMPVASEEQREKLEKRKSRKKKEPRAAAAADDEKSSDDYLLALM